MVHVNELYSSVVLYSYIYAWYKLSYHPRLVNKVKLGIQILYNIGIYI